MFPVSEDETDRVKIKENAITIKSYGLPMIFWGYLIAIIVVVTAMYLAVSGAITKLIATEDTINVVLAYSVLAIIYGLPSLLIALYFYEKSITKKANLVTIQHKVFWIPVMKKVVELEDSDAIELHHFMDSPNVAKMRAQPELKGFENRGYFELFATNKNGKVVFLDRHSRKADIIKIRDLLRKY
ncbi:hypothetical protein [Halobacteriovorax sp.]|uniref:hypothetical protein n=1 Tax=Halobacteriovorax sp. TaxID=2020862 RepID=UPI00356988FB